jgi:hypothetical protein
MTYRVQQNKNEYDIIEKDTNTVVYTERKENSARELCRSLNLGSGFNGYTPMFFTQSFKQKERPSTE